MHASTITAILTYAYTATAAAHAIIATHNERPQCSRLSSMAACVPKLASCPALARTCDPTAASEKDKAAAQRRIEFYIAWWANLIYVGTDYPSSMRVLEEIRSTQLGDETGEDWSDSDDDFENAYEDLDDRSIPDQDLDRMRDIQELKTAFPLLALSMETLMEQIQKNFKCSPDEDAYRLIVALASSPPTDVGACQALSRVLYVFLCSLTSFSSRERFPSFSRVNLDSRRSLNAWIEPLTELGKWGVGAGKDIKDAKSARA
ncbi:histone acetylase complex protein [Fusarium albosuccineum]|uniref:Histone acetylase complex protein n=1 Tax=Fusarium albosuccineum TaxID=1237068 RepID=A0A8H4L6X8_9HYPO|nr:histone acetylase complex protein [Fusarium albosuccineum]